MIHDEQDECQTLSRRGPSNKLVEEEEPHHHPQPTTTTIHRALKSVHWDNLTRALGNLAEIRNEIGILKQLDHPNILKAYETHDRHNFITIILELCTGGTLLAKSRARCTEQEAASIVLQILSAVAYMHSKGIIHRDLKCENIMWESHDKNAEIKILDFGLAIQRDNLQTSVHPNKAGTIYTMAPEVLMNHSFDEKADIWSVGVIAFMLLSGGVMPFKGTRRGDSGSAVKNIVQGNYNFHGDEWQKVSPDAKHFVRSLLEFHPKDRPSARQAQRHNWIWTQARARQASRKQVLLVESLFAHWMRYSRYNVLQKLALLIMAHQSLPQQVVDLRTIFHYLDGHGGGDIGGNGILTRAKFKHAVSNMLWHDACSSNTRRTCSDENIDQMFDGMDIYGKGGIEYTQFIAATLEPSELEEWRFAEAFDRLDSDDCGEITEKNLMGIFRGCSKLQREIENAFVSNNGASKRPGLSYQEFQQLF